MICRLTKSPAIESWSPGLVTVTVVWTNVQVNSVTAPTPLSSRTKTSTSEVPGEVTKPEIRPVELMDAPNGSPLAA